MSPENLSKIKKNIYNLSGWGYNTRKKDFICVGRLSMKFCQDFTRSSMLVVCIYMVNGNKIFDKFHRIF